MVASLVRCLCVEVAGARKPYRYVAWRAGVMHQPRSEKASPSLVGASSVCEVVTRPLPAAEGGTILEGLDSERVDVDAKVDIRQKLTLRSHQLQQEKAEPGRPEGCQQEEAEPERSEGYQVGRDR